MKNLKKIPLKDKVAIVLILAMVVTNPFLGQYVLDGLDWAFQQMFLRSAWVSLVGASYLLGLTGYNSVKSTKTHIPKTKKSGTIPLIET